MALGDASAQKKLTPIRWSDSCTKQFKAGGSIPTGPREAVRPERLRRGACRVNLRFAQIDHETNAAETPNKGSEEEAHGGRCARTNTIVKIEGAEVEARWEGVLGDLACLLDDGVDGQSNEDRPQRIALLNSPGAGNGLITSSAGAREKMTVMALTAVDPKSDRKEVGADRLQDSGAMHGAEGVGNVI